MTADTFFRATAVALGLLTAAGLPAQAGGVVNAPDADWTGGLVTGRILTTIMEQELGYKVKLAGG